MRVVIAENVVDHIFFRDVIGARNYKVFNVVAAQQFSGGTVGGDLPEDVEAKRILLERAHPETKTATTEPVATTTNTTTTTTNNIFIVADDKKIADILPGMREVSPVTPKELETTEVKAIETKEGKDD